MQCAFFVVSLPAMCMCSVAGVTYASLIHASCTFRALAVFVIVAHSSSLFMYNMPAEAVWLYYNKSPPDIAAVTACIRLLQLHFSHEVSWFMAPAGMLQLLCFSRQSGGVEHV
jgi:hypothetical protein